jgi:hypothetical protein
MKLFLLVLFFAIFSFISATSTLPKSKSRIHRLQWLLKSAKRHHASKADASPTSTRHPPGWPTVSDVGSPYPWYTSPTPYPWWETTTTPYPWYYTTTTQYPWYQTTTPYPWYYTTTTPYPWYQTTTPYPWWETTTTPYPWYQTTTPYPWYTGTTNRYTPFHGFTTTQNPNSQLCPYGTISSMSKQQCFKIFYGNLTFIEAEMDCQKYGGYLASIHNAFDNMLLNDYARNMFGTDMQYFIGANDLNSFKSWNWTDGSYFDFVDWYKNQEVGDYFDCAQVVTTNGAWKKVDCYSRAPYACTVPSYSY